MGPRFFIPRRFLPVPYDYRRAVPPRRDIPASSAGSIAPRRSTEMTPLRSGGASDVRGEDDEDLDALTSENPLLGPPPASTTASTGAGAPGGGGDGGDIEAGDGRECVICYCSVNTYDGRYMVRV